MTKSKRNKHLPPGLTILHEDRDIIVVNKPIGLLSMGHAKEKINTVYHAMTQYVKKGQAKAPHRVFIVHRLDRDTSGVLILAKTPDAKHFLQDNWQEFQKFYSAVVHGQPENKMGILSHHLAENKAKRVYVTQDKEKGKLARTRYQVTQESKKLSLLDIELLTGRKNQIRVQLAELGHHVVGDKKYGKDEDKFRKMALHAREIHFIHPYSKKPMQIAAPLPGHFAHLMSGKASLKDTSKPKKTGKAKAEKASPKESKVKNQDSGKAPASKTKARKKVQSAAKKKKSSAKKKPSKPSKKD